MGYQVGCNGISAARRRDVLDYVYKQSIPKVNSPEYMAEWGEPRSGKRLKKLADSLAAFARAARRRQFSDMDEANFRLGK